MIEKHEVLTVRNISFTDDKSGRQISGKQIWLISPSSDPSWNGFEVFKVWVDANSSMITDAAQLRRGDFVQASFGRNGKLRALTLIP